MAIFMIMTVGEAIAGKQHASAVIDPPPGCPQVADDRFHGNEAAVAEIEPIALSHWVEAIGEFRKSEMIVAYVTVHGDTRIALQDTAETAGMGRFLMRQEQVPERRMLSAAQDGTNLLFNYEKILGMSCF